MAVERLDFRVDSEHRRQLAKVAEIRGASMSATIRALIEQAYDDVLLQERIRAAERLRTYEIEEMPDPDTLSRQLAETYDTPLP